VAQRGFSTEFLEQFSAVRVEDGTACARASGGKRVMVEDVDRDRKLPAASWLTPTDSVPCSPRRSLPDGRTLGILSTHFAARPLASGTGLLDIYARHAAT
jgi:hypothetical protein